MKHTNKVSKLVKGLLITALACVAVGGGVVVAGVSLGGTMDDASIRIGRWNLIQPFGGSMAIAENIRLDESTDDLEDDQDESEDMDDDTDDTDDEDLPDTADGYVFSADEIKTLDIRLHTSGELTMRQSEDDSEVLVDVSGADECLVELDGDTLSITDKESSTQTFKRKKQKVAVSVPADYEFGRIMLDMGAMDVHVDQLMTKELVVHGGAGEFDAKSLVVSDSMKAQLGVGDLTVQRARLGESTIKCGVGALDIKSCELNGDIKIEGGIGDAYLGLDGQKDDYNYELTCGVGELEVFGRTYQAVGQKKTLDHDADCTIRLRCGIGSMSVGHTKNK